jgi:uncharacterized membrane protein YkvA (DUF1232 family)
MAASRKTRRKTPKKASRSSKSRTKSKNATKAAKRPERAVTKAAKKPAPASERRGRGALTERALASRTFRRAQRQAEDYLSNPQKAGNLAKKATAKLKAHRADVKDVADGIQTLIRMIRAYARGDYREVPWTTMVAATGAIVYFVSPVDLIPDPIVAIGYTDDALVIAFVIAAIQSDLDAFLGWEARRRK